VVTKGGNAALTTLSGKANQGKNMKQQKAFILVCAR
jgi:hypothetical protein